MKLLDQFISHTGKQPADWTKQDIEGYLDYVKAHVAEAAVSKRHDSCSNIYRDKGTESSIFRHAVCMSSYGNDPSDQDERAGGYAEVDRTGLVAESQILHLKEVREP